MTSKREKIGKIKKQLRQFCEVVKYRCQERNIPIPDKITIKRYFLKEHIQAVLSITDPHTLNNWIRLIESLGIIQRNPSSIYQGAKIKPSNDTKYVIHENQLIPNKTLPNT